MYKGIEDTVKILMTAIVISPLVGCTGADAYFHRNDGSVLYRGAVPYYATKGEDHHLIKDQNRDNYGLPRKDLETPKEIGLLQTEF